MRDWAKEANQLHIEFHLTVVENPDRDKALEMAHNLFDTLVIWIEEMNKEMLRLEGEVRALKDLGRV